MADLVILQQRLTEAETAYHQLALGKAVAEFRDQNGEQVRYSSANRGALAAYIADLRRQIEGACPRPMRVLFP